MKYRIIIFLLPIVLAMSCNNSENGKNDSNTRQEHPFTIDKSMYGTSPAGTVDQYTLRNGNGMTIKIITYGGIITELTAPDRNGEYADVVLGFDNLEAYLGPHPFFGAIVGRYGNRIGGAKFSLDDKEFQLAANNGENTLHGGNIGFDKNLWAADTTRSDDRVGVILKRTSPHLEEGFPGNLDVTVGYYLTANDELLITYEATTDAPTICNLTNHSYFNLKGAGNGTILDHEIVFKSSKYTPVDEGLIPTGEIADAVGTPFDFSKPKAIGLDIDADHEQTKIGKGYDHNIVLDQKADGLALAATVYEPTTGRVMEMLTTEPGVQYYTGNFLTGDIIGKGGKVYPHRAALCLETQHYPDSPNKPDFPSVRLDPGDTYRSSTMYRFTSR